MHAPHKSMEYELLLILLTGSLPECIAVNEGMRAFSRPKAAFSDEQSGCLDVLGTESA